MNSTIYILCKSMTEVIVADAYLTKKLVDDDVELIYSADDQERWLNRIDPIVKEAGSVFICLKDSTSVQFVRISEFHSRFKTNKNIVCVPNTTITEELMPAIILGLNPYKEVDIEELHV